MQSNNGLFQHYFWTYFHRSDSSAARRWALAFFCSLSGMPIFGSVFSAVMLACSVVALLYFALDRERFHILPQDQNMLLMFGIYFLVMLSSALLHTDRFDGLFAVLPILGMPIMALMVPVLREFSNEHWQEWFKISVGVSGLAIGFSAWAEIAISATARTEALSGNSLIFAFMAGLIFLFCLVLAFDTPGRKRLFLLAGSLCALAGIVTSGGRSPLAAAVLVAVLIAIHSFASRRRSWKTDMLIAYAALCIVAVFYEIVDDTKSFKWLVERTAAVGTQSQLGDRLRLRMLIAGWDAFAASPLAGYGPQNVMSVVNAQTPDSAPLKFSHLHNAYLNEAVGSGILGVVTLLAAIWAPVLMVYRNKGVWLKLAMTLSAFTSLYFLTNKGFQHDLVRYFFCTCAVAIAVVSRPVRTG